MPLILSPQDEERWLDPQLDEKGIGALLKTYGEQDMDAYALNPDFIHRQPP